MSSREAAMFFERANPRVTGSMMATMAVLFIHALKKAVMMEKEKMAVRVFPESRSRRARPM